MDSVRNELPKDHEALMVFCEVLDIMNVKIPEELKEKRDAIVVIHKIPVGKNHSNSSPGTDDEVEQKREFFSYTTNKMLAKLGEMLSVKHVYAMRRTIIDEGSSLSSMQDEGDLRRIAKSMENLDVKDEDPTFKDLLFYYIILNLRRYEFLTRLHSHALKNFIEDSKPDGMDAEKEKALSKSMEQLDRYPITPKSPGICIIFAMKERREKGTDEDVENLEKLFEEFFNYDVHVICDPSKEEINKFVTELESDRYMFYDSFISIFLAHGSKSYLIVKDGEKIHRRDEFIIPFSEIGWLRKKPKLFFIQACADRDTEQPKAEIENEDGKETMTDGLGTGITTDATWNRIYGNRCDGDINCFADTLVSYATMWYKKASRGKSGSLYINTLIQTLRDSGKTMSIEDNLRQMHYKVNTVRRKRRVKDSDKTKFEIWKQTPYFESSLEKKFIFPE